MQLILTSEKIELLLFFLLLLYVYIQGYKHGNKDKKNNIVTLKKDGYDIIILASNIRKQGVERSTSEVSFLRKELKAFNFFSKEGTNDSIEEAFTEQKVFLN